MNPYASYIEAADGLDKLEALQNHQNNEIYEKAVKIIEDYFGGEEEEDQNIAPNMETSSNTFSFGSNLQPSNFVF